MIAVALLLILAAIYSAVGIYTAFLFRKDKKASENGEWRISEKKLLGMIRLFRELLFSSSLDLTG